MEDRPRIFVTGGGDEGQEEEGGGVNCRRPCTSSLNFLACLGATFTERKNCRLSGSGCHAAKQSLFFERLGDYGKLADTATSDRPTPAPSVIPVLSC